MRRRLLVFVPALLAGFGLTACHDQGPTAFDDAQVQASIGEAIAGEWIVVFNDNVPDAPGLARQLVTSHGGALRFTYRHALKGFAASLPDAAVAALQRNPQVAYVAPDQMVQAWEAQVNPTWGLDRIDQHNLPLNKSYLYDNTGAGVHAYIIDTGINVNHAEFSGRAISGIDYVDGGDADDCNGHGTHVAGTVGGETYGVAKDVSIVAVRVLDCGGVGSMSGVIAGIDWVTANAHKPAVANMSLGSSAYTPVDDAVRGSVAAGISYAVAAGNGNWIGIAQDACKYSPARVAEAMTIGATSSSDVKASWSNYGNCVDWFAPGVSITSAWNTSNTATNTISGTSMATPHTAGVAALYLQANPGATPAQVRDALYEATTKGIVSSSRTTNNHLLYSLFTGGAEPPVGVPPSAGFTVDCSELTCNFTDTSTDDGTIIGWSWSFGDGATSGAQHPSHTYTGAATYSVTLTVTDDDELTGTTTKSITVAPVSQITLSVTTRKVKTNKYADLTWSGAVSASVDVYRNGVRVISTPNDGSYTDKPAKSLTSATYKICEAGTSICSNEVPVTW